MIKKLAKTTWIGFLILVGCGMCMCTALLIATPNEDPVTEVADTMNGTDEAGPTGETSARRAIQEAAATSVQRAIQGAEPNATPMPLTPDTTEGNAAEWLDLSFEWGEAQAAFLIYASEAADDGHITQGELILIREYTEQVVTAATALNEFRESGRELPARMDSMVSTTYDALDVCLVSDALVSTLFINYVEAPETLSQSQFDDAMESINVCYDAITEATSATDEYSDGD